MVKKYIFISVPIFIIIFTFSGCLLYDSVREANIYKKRIGVNLPKDSKVIKSEDSHGGMMGDGVLKEEIQLTNESVEDFAKKAKETGMWSDFPLSEELRYRIYGEKTENINHSLYRHYLKRWTGILDSSEIASEEEFIIGMNNSNSYFSGYEIEVPDNVKNGIYMYRDRFAEMYPEAVDEEYYSIFSGNYTISILDYDTNILYIYAYDS